MWTSANERVQHFFLLCMAVSILTVICSLLNIFIQWKYHFGFLLRSAIEKRALHVTYHIDYIPFNVKGIYFSCSIQSYCAKLLSEPQAWTLTGAWNTSQLVIIIEYSSIWYTQMASCRLITFSLHKLKKKNRRKDKIELCTKWSSLNKTACCH